MRTAWPTARWCPILCACILSLPCFVPVGVTAEASSPTTPAPETTPAREAGTPTAKAAASVGHTHHHHHNGHHSTVEPASGGPWTTVSPYYDDSQDIPSVSTGKYPYRICMALSTDLVRFGKTIECPAPSPKTPTEEGIMLVYKQDIVAYTFKVITYYKNLQFQRSYAYIWDDYLLGTTVNRLAMPCGEIDQINRNNSCYSTAQRVMGDVYIAYHRDEEENVTMPLIPDDYVSSSSSRFVSTKDAYHRRRKVWMYTESCTINCVVTVTKARSNRPYSFFVLSSGEVVETSPFFNGTNDEPFEEDTANFRVEANYEMVDRFGDWNVSTHRVHRMAFLERPEVTIAWEIQNKSEALCEWKRWQVVVKRAIRTAQNSSYHFVSRSLTATFVTGKHQHNINQTKYVNCILNGTTEELDRVFEEEYNETHVKDGNVEVYQTSGGLLVFWQKIKPKRLHELGEAIWNITGENVTESEGVNNTSRSRRRRDVSSVDDIKMDITYTQLQFTYDILRDYINGALQNILEAWCLDQKRQAEMLRELSKINPSNILSSIYGRPVTAKLAGDVLALSECVPVDQDSVKILKDMRIFVDNKVVNCYARPHVLFKFVNSSKIESGQLGEHNEILLGNHRTERCETPSRKIFITDEVGYEFRDYVFKNVTNLKDIELIDTMIGVSLEPLENTDFQILELYSRGEIRASNVFNLEEIMREYNAQKQSVRFLFTQIIEDTPPYLRGLDDFMQGLGAAGKGIGMVFGAVAGAVGSIASGFVSFLTNPFGTVTIIIIVIAIVLVIYIIFRRQQQAVMRPVEYFFPHAMQVAGKPLGALGGGDDRPPSYEDSTSQGKRGNVTKGGDDAGSGHKKGSGKAYSGEDAAAMLRALQDLEESGRQAAIGVAKKVGRNILDRLRGNSGYQSLPDSDVEDR
ncbi:pR55 [rat cytomegalovirus strain Maastricht]|uniref:PR55 n=1 Tax=Rat cytomegalovirus (strain Maastricht) TaxID=79700 RepID=Q85427_RCMVM|nr:pR55 [rat cytomegalovirus strain Maastricht]AAC56432.1 pR55 [rat cytomegalovirus strain Maastricht]